MKNNKQKIKNTVKNMVGNKIIQKRDEYYEKIIPTAWMVAYRRKLSDIPFSKEIFDKIDLLRKTIMYKGISNKVLKQSNLAPQIEARYKLLNKLILENHSHQILEIASGFSPRGLEMTEDNLIIYVESDLSRILIEKKIIVMNILREFKIIRKNLYFEKGNALNLKSLLRTTTHFKKSEPITIVNEGLLRYLNFEEKIKIAKNINYLLKRFGGVWITCDITLQNVLKKEEMVFKGLKDFTRKLTGIQITNNSFKNEEEAKKFFEKQGFKVECHSFLEVFNKLVSPKRIHMSDNDVKKLIGSSVVFVMRLKHS